MTKTQDTTLDTREGNRRRVLLFGVIGAIVCGFLEGCETRRDSGGPAGQEKLSSVRSLTADEIEKFLSVDYATIVPSTDRAITGDLRPYWIVGGRIKNDWPGDLKSVRLRFVAYDKTKGQSAPLDTAEIEVADIPSRGVKAFRQQIHLLVFPHEFEFSYEILSATERPQ